MIVARGGKRGKTSGRGGKGQSARAGNKRRPEWRDIIKRLPKLRGRGVNQNKPVTNISKVINIDVIETIFENGETVTPTTLIEKGVISRISGKIPMIKILGDGEITKAVKVSGCAISASAKEKIEKAGGSVTALASRVIEKQKPINTNIKKDKVQEKIEDKKPVEVKVSKKAEKKPVKAKATKTKEKVSEK